MGFQYLLPSGLAILIIGVALIWNRINFIRKGNRAIATVVKLEEHLDSDNDMQYTPHFKFTTYHNKDITYVHYASQSKYTWRLGEQVKVVYKEVYFNDYEVLLLTFYQAFGLSTLLLTVGIALLAGVGCIYWQASYITGCYVIPISIILPVMGISIWSIRFFNTLD